MSGQVFDQEAGNTSSGDAFALPPNFLSGEALVNSYKEAQATLTRQAQRLAQMERERQVFSHRIEKLEAHFAGAVAEGVSDE